MLRKDFEWYLENQFFMKAEKVIEKIGRCEKEKIIDYFCNSLIYYENVI